MVTVVIVHDQEKHAPDNNWDPVDRGTVLHENHTPPPLVILHGEEKR